MLIEGTAQVTHVRIKYEAPSAKDQEVENDTLWLFSGYPSSRAKAIRFLGHREFIVNWVDLAGTLMAASYRLFSTCNTYIQEQQPLQHEIISPDTTADVKSEVRRSTETMNTMLAYMHVWEH